MLHSYRNQSFELLQINGFICIEKNFFDFYISETFLVEAGLSIKKI